MGEKEKALSVLQQAAISLPDSKSVASEQGRLALELGQLDYAEKMLARADNPAAPDWRVLSAKGTLSAKRGEHKLAAGYFERARQIAPSEPSVLNNLALAYALDGRPADAEALLKEAAAKGGDTTRVRQNLALVLGVQGKFDEAKSAVSGDLEKDRADANIAYLQKMVKATPVALASAPAKPTKADVIANAWATEAVADEPAWTASTVALAK